jgi:hypothetical protein
MATFAALVHVDNLVLGPNVMKAGRHVQEETVTPSRTTQLRLTYTDFGESALSKVDLTVW